MILTKENLEKINIDHIINSKIKSDSLDELLIIVPTNRKARFLKKELIDHSKEQTARKINIETISSFAEKILLSDNKFNSLSDSAASVFIEQSVDKNNLRYFSTYKGEIPSGTLDKIKNVISEYKKQGIYPDTLKKEAEKLETSEKLKALDIADIFEIFLDKCQKINALQTGDIYRKFNCFDEKTLKLLIEKKYPGINLVLINGFAEFTFPEISIINKISDIEGIQLFLNFDYFRFNPQVFSSLDECYERFVQYGFRKIIDETEINERKFIKLLREGIFREDQDQKTFFKDQITLINASDRIEEIELVAKEIKKLIVEEKVESNKICLAFNLVNNYSEIVRDVFYTHKIPVNLTDRLSLEKSPVVISIISFLEILENDFYYKNIIRAFSSGFITLNNVDINSIFNAANSLKIISGKENWIRSLNDFIDNNQQSEKVNTALYSKALNGIKEISNLLTPFNKKLKIKEFYDKLLELIYSLKITESVLKKSNDKEEINIKGLTVFLETIEEICLLLKLEYGEETEFDLQFYLKQIKVACGRARFNIKEKSDYGVLITAVNEIRGLQFDYLFLGGMNDGDFPTKYNPEIFFSGSFSRKEIQHQNEERYYFYQTLCCWRKKLYLSNSHIGNNKELEESIFLKEFKKLFETKIIQKEDYANYLFSDEEVQIINGQGIKADKQFNLLQNISEIEIKTLKAVIEINELRKDLSKKSEFGGFIDLKDELVNNHIDKFSSKEYSVSQLEIYAKCPFKFFLERLLKLETIEDPTEEIEALEIGNILHEILFEFYSDIRSEKVLIQDCSSEVFNYCVDKMFSIADKYFNNNSLNLPLSFWEKEKIFGEEDKRSSSLLYKFLEYERDNKINGQPEYFEVAFGSVDKEGSDKNLFYNKPVELNGVKVRGKIDRIEIDNQNKTFNIVDYKTGNYKPTMGELSEGLSLQLPIYLVAAEKILKEKFGDDFKGLGMFIYNLKYNEDSFGRNEVKFARKKLSDEEIAECLKNSLDKLSLYAASISEGVFNLSLQNNREELVCRYCNFKNVCRISAIN